MTCIYAAWGLWQTMYFCQNDATETERLLVDMYDIYLLTLSAVQCIGLAPHVRIRCS